ncbi:MAG: hypothetical protein K2K60_01590 [Clostridia bacterium]|nr:hypothetical protein [Clostridia bacterium]
MKIKLVLCAALAAIVCACAGSAACFMLEKKKADGPVDFTIGEVTDTTIEIVDWVYADGETYRAEFSIDGENWIEESTPKFTGLISNTEYTVYGRGHGWGDLLPSDPVTKMVRTLRSVNTNLPEVDYAQERGKITLTGITPEMEVSFDNGETYSDIYEHTYTQKGEYEILVRYKLSDRCFEGEPATVKVQYSDFFGGLGTEGKPYIVSSYEELRLLNDKSNYYKLLNDITFPAEECLPVKFTGTLDGNGKKFISPKIKNAENSSDNGAAIFSGTVSAKNLTVENAVITSSAIINARIGILASTADTLINCNVSGEVILNGAEGYCGGLAGYLVYGGEIQNSSADVSIKYDGNSGSYKDLFAGGLIGLCYYTGEISNSSANMSLRMTNSDIGRLYAGGITGSKGDVLMSGCSAEVDIYACASDAYVGGIAGGSNDTEQLKGAAIVNCFACGQIVVQKPASSNHSSDLCHAGGIIGGRFSNGSCSVSGCVSSVDISIDGTGLNVKCGGIMGDAYAYSGHGDTGERFIENCLYTGNIAVNTDSEKYNYIQAILGSNYDNNGATCEVKNCFIKTQPSPDVVTESGAAAVEEETYLSASWQRENLKLDETVWTIAEGELPKLK